MARAKTLDNGWPIAKDYRDADGTEYVIVRETNTNPHRHNLPVDHRGAGR
jgi:hypothetical protein